MLSHIHTILLKSLQPRNPATHNKLERKKGAHPTNSGSSSRKSTSSLLSPWQWNHFDLHQDSTGTLKLHHWTLSKRKLQELIAILSATLFSLLWSFMIFQAVALAQAEEMQWKCHRSSGCSKSTRYTAPQIDLLQMAANLMRVFKLEISWDDIERVKNTRHNLAPWCTSLKVSCPTSIQNICKDMPYYSYYITLRYALRDLEIRWITLWFICWNRNDLPAGSCDNRPCGEDSEVP